VACETIRTFLRFLRFFQNPKKHDFLRFFQLLHTFSRTLLKTPIPAPKIYVLGGFCFVIKIPKRHILGRIRVVKDTSWKSVHPFCCRRRQEKKERKGKGRKGKERYAKSQVGYISAIWGADLVGPISTNKIGKVVRVHDVIIHSNFGFNIFSGSQSHLIMHRTNGHYRTLTLVR